MNSGEKNFNKNLRQYKKESVRTKEYNNWNKKNTLEGINSRLDDTEEWISNLEDKSSGNHPIRTAKRNFLNEDSLRDLWDNIKYADICIIGVLEGEKRKRQKKKNLAWRNNGWKLP